MSPLCRTESYSHTRNPTLKPPLPAIPCLTFQDLSFPIWISDRVTRESSVQQRSQGPHCADHLEQNDPTPPLSFPCQRHWLPSSARQTASSEPTSPRADAPPAQPALPLLRLSLHARRPTVLSPLRVVQTNLENSLTPTGPTASWLGGPR